MTSEIKVTGGLAIASIVAWWVSLHLAIQLLFWFQLADIASGFLSSIALRGTSSHIAWRSITAKKSLSWLVVGAMVGIGWLIHQISGVAVELSLGTFSLPLGAGAAVYYCYVETISVLENAGKVNALPPGLLDLIRKYLPGARPPGPPPVPPSNENPAAGGTINPK